jgi:hypothetical protein
MTIFSTAPASTQIVCCLFRVGFFSGRKLKQQKEKKTIMESNRRRLLLEPKPQKHKRRIKHDDDALIDFLD